jgi:hypothetical protein
MVFMVQDGQSGGKTFQEEAAAVARNRMAVITMSRAAARNHQPALHAEIVAQFRKQL